MNFREVAEQYKKACAHVSTAIKSSIFKTNLIIQRLGFEKSPAMYYRRLNAQDWEPEHLEKLGLLLEEEAALKQKFA